MITARAAGPLLVAACVVACTTGCDSPRAEPALQSPFARPMVVAVAPAINFSGSSDFDPVQVGDLFASELGHIDKFTVLPVNRVLAVLAAEQRVRVDSPGHAIAVAEALGADGLFVIGVTEYDPYDPPVVGLAVQMYCVADQPRAPALDPVTATRQARPFIVEPNAPAALRPKLQAQRVYNAAHDQTYAWVRQYAGQRTADPGPYGWRRYLKDQRLYLRFCCWAALTELMTGRTGPLETN